MSAESPVLPIFAGEVVDQAGGSSEHDTILPPDLTAAELLPSMDGAGDAVPEGTLVGSGASPASRPTFALLAVVGGNMPSPSSKFVGATPRAAVLKAARRIHKRSGGKTKFQIIMRRVASKKADKKLYSYSVEMRKCAKPDGFVTLIDPSFHSVDGKVERNVAKKARLVQARKPEHETYGYIDREGNLKKGAVADGGVEVVRSKGTNTIYIVVSGPMPDKLNGVPVIKTEWEIGSLSEHPLSEADRQKWDVAGQARSAAEEEAKRKSDAKKLAAEKKKAKERAEKERAKEIAANKREKERARAAAEKAKLAEKKLKEKAKLAKAKELERKKTGKKSKKQTGSGAGVPAPVDVLEHTEHVTVGGGEVEVEVEA